MSFIYGGSDSNSLAGVTATLNEWPSLDGLSLITEETPGHDGRSFHGATREFSQFVFEVIISGATSEEVAQRRDNFIGMIDPSRGPRPLVVEFDTLWQWQDVMVSESISWERFGWQLGSGFNLRGEVTFETVGLPDAREVTPQSVPFTGTTLFTLSRGNTASYPKLTFPAKNATGQPPFVVNIGAFTVEVKAGIAAGLRASMDWETFEFYLLNASGSRVASLVPFMSHYQRPMLVQGAPTSISVTKSGAGVAGVVLYPNNRRV